MGCGTSSNTVVHPLTKDETESKLSGRGDSAVSKGTTDSGVVMENRDVPALPGMVPDKLPPLTSESIREREMERVTQESAASDVLQQDNPVPERLESNEILEELLSQGIIPAGQSGEKGSGAAYTIMLDEKVGDVRRPPARLESLKAKKAETLHSREDFDERMRLAEERRKFKEDERRRRLRTMSARVRRIAPVSSPEEDKDALLDPVELLQTPPTSGVTQTALPQVPREDAEGGESIREAGGDGREETGSKRGWLKEKGNKEKGRGDGGEEEEEELTHVEELKAGELSTSGELESDSSFQNAKEEEIV